MPGGAAQKTGFVREAPGRNQEELRCPPRIVSIVTTVAIVVIVVLPGTFPAWLKVEQSVCGVLMLGVALLANGRTARSRFSL